MNYDFNLSNPFAEPAPFNLEATQGAPQMVPQGGPQGGSGNNNLLDALRALGLNAQGGGGDQNELLRMMIQQWAQQMEAKRAATIRPDEEYMAQARAIRYARDPVGAAIADQNAETASHSGIDWFKRANNIDQPTPEARIAMQGPSATNQWARLGAYQGIDPTEVARLANPQFNAGRAANSAYMPQGRYV